MNETFDYVVVGAGSAGCVLANWLTEDGGSKVLVLEYGGSDRSVLHSDAGRAVDPDEHEKIQLGLLHRARAASGRAPARLSARQGPRRIVLDQRPRLCPRPSQGFRSLGRGGRARLGVSRRASLFQARRGLASGRGPLSRRRRPAGDVGAAHGAIRYTTPSSRRAGRPAIPSAPTSTANSRKVSAAST